MKACGICLAMLLSLGANPAISQSPSQPVSAFLTGARGAYVVCTLSARTGLANAGHACVDKERAAQNSLFETARKVLAKDPNGLSMLRDYYAFWLAALEDSQPRTDETAQPFISRTGDTARQLNERAIRIELQLGLR